MKTFARVWFGFFDDFLSAPLLNPNPCRDNQRYVDVGSAEWGSGGGEGNGIMANCVYYTGWLQSAAEEKKAKRE